MDLLIEYVFCDVI